MMESVAERSQGRAGALRAPEVNRRDPFARLWMRDRETTRAKQADGGIDVVVSHQRRVVELNHAIDSPRWRMREWRRRLRQPLRMRRNIRMFFIGFLQICWGWLPFWLISASGSVAPEAFASLDVGEIRDAARAAATVASRFFRGRRRDRREDRNRHKGRRGIEKRQQPVCFGFGGGGGGQVHFHVLSFPHYLGVVKGLTKLFCFFFFVARIAARSMSLLSLCRAVASRVCWRRMRANGSPAWSLMESAAASPARTAAVRSPRMSLRLLTASSTSATLRCDLPLLS